MSPMTQGHLPGEVVAFEHLNNGLLNTLNKTSNLSNNPWLR